MTTTLKIVEQYQESVQHIKNAIELSHQGNITNAQIELGKSSNCIYSCLEWAVKNYLLNKFSNPTLHFNEQAIINAPNFRNKFKLFQKNVTPSFESLNIDGKLILDLKQNVRNDPEHSGYVPHYRSLVKVVNEGRKIISNYIDQNANLNEVPEDFDFEITEDSNWSEFYNSADSFNKDKNYILIIGPTEDFSADKLEYIGLLDWSLIIDFNNKTEIAGLYKQSSKHIERRKKIHLITKEDNVSFSPFNSTYWLGANGLEGRQQTIANDFKSWNRKYSTFLPQFLISYFKSFGDKPTDIVILWDEQPYIQKICEIIDSISGEKAKFIYAVPDVNKLSNVIELYDGLTINITIPQIADGILRIRNLYTQDFNSELYTLPAKDEEFISISISDFLWFEEDFEVLHRNILDTLDFTDQDLPERDRFYRGNQISWIGLQLNHDVNREKTVTIKRKIEKGLREREPIKYTLHHHPGIGGTTLSRRIAWDFKNDYPVLLLRKYRQQDTIEKLYKVFDLTKKPILLLVETSIVNIDDFNRFFDELLSRNFACVCLVIQRREYNPHGTFNLEDILTDNEFQTFIAKYKELMPQKVETLNLILNSSEKKERHPFYLGLITFEENFDGLDKFIEKNIAEATEIQKKILALIALCYYYGQKGTSAQLFSLLLSTSENSVVLLEKHLPPSAISLLINEEDITWRPIHYLVAKELLIQLLSGDIENRGLWKNNLGDLAISLITLISEKSSVLSDSETELLKRLFVYRDNQEILGKEEESLFSNFIENGLQTDEARLRIFLQLTVSFPEASHFWAHLARFYSLKIRNHTLALEAINKAIYLSDENDSLLFHMKGMCLRAIAREKMSLLKGKTCSKEEVNEIYRIVDEADEAFMESRNINPSNEHGYISNIQLLINVIDFSYSISKYNNKTEFLRNLNIWLQEKLDLAEELLDTMKLQTQMKSNNIFVEKCDLLLQELYENYSLVIEGWNNLLSKADTKKTVIRRSIIRAYVRRANSWDTVSNEDIDKIINLIEENISEEPNNGHNIYLWFQAARQTDKIDINTAIDKVSNWRAILDSDDSLFYLGVLHTIQAIEGSSLSKIKAEKIIQELSERMRNRPYRTHCFEWYGNGFELKKIIPYKIAIAKDENNENIYNEQVLKKTTGKISYIKGPEAGNIELSCGLIARFIPARANISRDKDQNRNVKFFLGFSNDGLRAYEVELN